LRRVGWIALFHRVIQNDAVVVVDDLAAQTKPDSPYREWVMTNSNEQFEAIARRLEVLLDRYGGDHDRLAVLYHQAMELELRFFDAAVRWKRR